MESGTIIVLSISAAVIILVAVILVLSTAAGAQELNSAAYGLAYNSGGMDLQLDGKSLIPTFTQLSDGYIFNYGRAVKWIDKY